jgi:DNA segregation ATPase FtsK/SpoIIIE, S-DNA-T family
VIFDPSWRFTAAKEKFVVPLNRYAFGTTKNERVTTTITRADFEQMRAIAHEVNPASPTSPPSPTASQPPAAGTASSQPAASPSSSPPKDRTSVASDQRPAGATSASTGSAAPTVAQPPQKEEPELTPTGRTSADPKQSRAATESLSAAKAIRETFAREAATIAQIDVAVNPENGSIVLRGSVPDEQLKKSIEEKAKQAAKGARIDSQIAVEKKPASTPTPSVNSPAKEPAPTPPRVR